MLALLHHTLLATVSCHLRSHTYVSPPAKPYCRLDDSAAISVARLVVVLTATVLAGCSLSAATAALSSSSVVTGSSAFPSSWNVSACSTTFAHLDTVAVFPWLNYRPLSFHCPPRCAASPFSNLSVLYGSYPYSALSSVCLSAVHCGVVDDILGGSVFVSRFYRHDWSNSSSQTIFPFSSSHGSKSNGVYSADVPSHHYSVPSNGTSWSYVVRGRGEFVQQRRSAPFSPRSDHTHISFPPTQTIGAPSWNTRAPPYQSVHIIVGGYDGAHYLNDVWLAKPAVWLQADSDVEWSQLDDAPFSPRSDMQTAMTFNTDDDGEPQRQFHVFLFGGQTSHECGLYELGVCSDEVWQLQMNVSFPNRNLVMSFIVQSIKWTSIAPVGRLPFSPRCGASAVYLADSGRATLMIGGQLSYTDPSCQAAPITLSEVWIADDSANYSDWRQGSDAPFSARRSQQRDDVLAALPQDGVQSRFVGDIYPLIGGLRVINVTNGGDGTRLGALQLWADVWICNPYSLPPTFRSISCSWSWSQSSQQPVNSVPTTSVPLPSALGCSATARSAISRSVSAGQRFGGFTAQEAVETWTRIRPLDHAQPDGAFNWTFLRRAYPYSDNEQSLSFIALQRFEAPLDFTLSAEELSDPSSAYNAGSEWVQSHSPWLANPLIVNGRGSTVTSISTIHPQRFNLALDPLDATVFLPQAASSTDTQRPHFLFALPRLSASFDDWSNSVFSAATYSFLYSVGQRIVSGGRAGNRTFNDWIAMGEVRCLPPDDPSYLTLLGPVLSRQSAAVLGVDSSYAVRDTVVVGCMSGYHFEPPVVHSPTAQFQCGPNGVWLDADLVTIRKCVANPLLDCAPPLVNTGKLYCQPPDPTVSALTANMVPNSNSNNVTLYDFPVTPNTILQVHGSYFTAPLVVMVGGQPCGDPLLTGKLVELTYNVSCSDESGGPVEVYREVRDVFSDSFSCVVPSLLGLHLPVQVVVGPAAVTASTLDLTGMVLPQGAAISSTAPKITFLAGYATELDKPYRLCTAVNGPDMLRLYDCPVMNAWNLSVCLDINTVAQLPLTVTLGASRVGLPCVDMDRSELSPDWKGDRCLRCLIAPFLGTQAVRVQHNDLALQSGTDASISSRSCPPGYETNYERAFNNNNTAALCQACPSGYSTRGAPNSPSCIECAIGTFAPNSGMGECLQCPQGSYFNDTGATDCVQCPLNQYQPQPGAGACIQCEQDTFVQYTGASNASFRSNGQCAACPEVAACHVSGDIDSTAGSFLLIDQANAIIDVVSCSKSACVDAQSEPFDSENAWIIERSGLHVVNHCAGGRYPAYTEHWHEVAQLRETEGVNVLCALCSPDHTQVSGHCIECASTHWNSLLLLLLASGSLVYLVHRLPHDWSGGATMTITAYFLQQSDLFLSFNHLSAFNLDILGLQRGALPHGHAQQWCVLPLATDGQRFAASLSTVPIVLALLLPIVLLHAGLSQVLMRTRHRLPGAQTCVSLYSIVFIAKLPKRSSVRGDANSSAVSDLNAPLWVKAEKEEETVGRVHEVSSAEVGEVAVSSSSPPSAAVLHLLQSFVHRWGADTAASAPPVWLLYQRSLVRMMQLSYTALALISVRFFHYQDVKQYGLRLVDYPAMAVSSTTYKLLAPLVIVVLTIVCCIPVVLLAFLFRQNRRGVMKQLNAADSSDAEAPMAPATPVAALTLQLCCMFKASCWWMASFIPLRRLLLVAVFVASPGAQRWVWLSLLNQLLLVVHLVVQPYKRQRDNSLESLNLVSLCMQTTLLGLGYSSAVPGTLEALVLCPLLVLLAVYLLLPAWRWLKVRRERSSGRHHNGAELESLSVGAPRSYETEPPSPRLVGVAD